MRGARSRIVLFSLCLAIGAMPIPACKQRKGEGQQAVEPGKAPARQSLEELRAEVGKAQKETSAIRARFNALPEDLPGLETVRSKLLAFEEVMGVENARVEWLSGELAAALASGNAEQIQKVSGTITGSIEGSRGLTKTLLELTHELLPFERMVAQFRALADAGLVFTRVLPTGHEIKAAPDGLEKQLIEFIDDGKKKVDKTTWFTFDRLWFSGDGAQLDLQQSNGQLDNVVAILKAFPQVKLEIGGYTDNTGPAAAGKKLSAARADAVKELLVTLGIAAPRLAAEGYGPARPVCAANDTEECKARNRRIAARVTAK